MRTPTFTTVALHMLAASLASFALLGTSTAETSRAIYLIGDDSVVIRRAVSPRGAQGLMQLMPGTARAYGVTDAFDPAQNIDAGTRHLRALLDQFAQDTHLALAAYNAGAGAVLRHGRNFPPYAETLAYVPRVLRHHARLLSRAPSQDAASPHSD